MFRCEAVNQAFIEKLEDIFTPDRVSTAQAVRDQHGTDESWHLTKAPDVVVFARTTEEIQALAKLCSREKVPMIPFGTGTSLEGHVAALQGGVSVDVTQMDAILTVNPEDMDVVVQAGVTRKQLNEHLRDTGLFFPIDPGADASIGGMTSTRASGTNAVRYGTMKENVLALTVVTPQGELVKTSRRARKSSAGYDLTHLYVGAEGTLGFITEITLKLHGIPEAISSGVCAFPDVEAAINSVIMTIQSGLPVARIEFLDEHQMAAVNAFSKMDYPEQPTLFYEFHGSDISVDDQARQAREIAAEFGGSDFKWASAQEDRDRLWAARHDAWYASLALKPGSKGLASDVCVPISRLADCIVETRKDLDDSFIITTIVGHVGDGNFHVLFIFDVDNPQELDEVKRLNDRLIHRALSMEGTCTGEHGVGHGKIQYLEKEHGVEALDVMRTLKRALDPDNLMNPGKIVAV